MSIYSRLKGGLGNQLFQYAAGKALSLEHNTSLHLDISSFKKDPLRKYELDAVTIEANSVNTLTNLLKSKTLRFLKKPLNYHYVREQKYHFDTDFFNYGPKILLNGYWQSYKYLEKHKHSIKLGLQPNFELNIKSKQKLDLLQNCESLAIHIRRSDYANDPETLRRFGLCSQEYYKHAIDIIMKKHPNIELFFFSDDLDWVKQNIHYPNLKNHYMDIDKTQAAFLDIYLMSKAKHNIIANSSFSWWGAWLNNNPTQTVICPKDWLNTNEYDIQAIAPEHWIKLKK